MIPIYIYICQALFQSKLDIVLSISGACNLGAQDKDLCANVQKKNLKFFLNYDKQSQQSRKVHNEALKTLKMLWFPALCQCILPGLCISPLPRGLTASRVPDLHQQLALTRRGSLPNVFFQNSPCMYIYDIYK